MYKILQFINFLFNWTLFKVSGQPISFYIIDHLIIGLIIAIEFPRSIKLICQQWLLEKWFYQTYYAKLIINNAPIA